MNPATRFTGAFWITLSLVVAANPSAEPVQTDSLHYQPVAADAGAAFRSVAVHTDAPATPVTTGKAPQSRPDFSGLWSLNVESSDNPEEKRKEITKAMRQTRDGKRGMGSGSGGHEREGGGGGAMGRGMGRGAQGHMGGNAMRPSRELLTLIIAAEQIDIRHEEPMLLITAGSDQRQRLFTDFRGASVSASGGFQQRVSVAGWEGSSLVVETTLNSGAKLIQTYQLDLETGQLVIAAEARLLQARSVPYRLVYDRLQSGTAEGNR